jgi:hypothetical protein
MKQYDIFEIPRDGSAHIEHYPGMIKPWYAADMLAQDLSEANPGQVFYTASQGKALAVAAIRTDGSSLTIAESCTFNSTVHSLVLAAYEGREADCSVTAATVYQILDHPQTCIL